MIFDCFALITLYSEFGIASQFGVVSRLRRVRNKVMPCNLYSIF